jgi:outer membrane lipoprotein carrier protein
MLLLSGSLDELHAAFTLAALPRRGGFDWVAVTPRAADAEFSRAEVGFSGAQLTRMVVTDRLGQTATLQFTQGKRNAAVPAQAFAFQPPAGADVIGTPVQ